MRLQHTIKYVDRSMTPYIRKFYAAKQPTCADVLLGMTRLEHRQSSRTHRLPLPAQYTDISERSAVLVDQFGGPVRKHGTQLADRAGIL